MHVSIVVSTGGGKSYLVRYGLLRFWLRNRILVIDAKDDPDDEMYGLGQVVRGYPGTDADIGAYRLVVPELEWEGPGKRRSESMRRSQEVVGHALDQVYKDGHWVLDLDEARAILDTTSEGTLGLRWMAEQIWTRGRTRDVTMIACSQETVGSRMPSTFYSQPALIYLGADVNLESEHLRAIGGDRDLVRAGVKSLKAEDHEFLAISKRPREMWIVRVE